VGFSEKHLTADRRSALNYIMEIEIIREEAT